MAKAKRSAKAHAEGRNLRSELMRMMGTLADQPSLLSDPGYSEQASKLIQLLRFGSDAGIDTYRDSRI